MASSAALCVVVGVLAMVTGVLGRGCRIPPIVTRRSTPPCDAWTPAGAIGGACRADGDLLPDRLVARTTASMIASSTASAQGDGWP